MKFDPVQVAEPTDGASEVHAIPVGRTVGSSPATGAKFARACAGRAGWWKFRNPFESDYRRRSAREHN
jgi:hypothetical protein